MPSARTIVVPVLALVASFAIVTAASADVTVSQKCQKAKILARGKWKACRSVERAKVVVGKTPDLTRCDDTLASKLVVAEKNMAADSLWTCRWVDNGDGTVSDLDTGLMWEKKDSADGVANLANPHDFDNVYRYHEATGIVVGESFLGLLNGEQYAGVPVQPGFAGYRDWRMPYVSELKSILDTTVSYGPSLACGSGDYTPCIRQSVFGPTVNCYSHSLDGPCRYHSSTVSREPGAGLPANQAVDFSNGVPRIQTGVPNPVRAVRGGGE
jgi:hypothetical protein